MQILRFLATFSSRWSRSGPVGKIILVALLVVLVLYTFNLVIIPLTADPAYTPTVVAGDPLATPASATAVSTRRPDALQVHFIDVGQGDAILLITPDGKTALIDGGESGSGVLEYLRSQGVQQLDLLVATHPHTDHIGGLVDVLHKIPVVEVVTSGQMHTSSTYEEFLDGIAAAQAVYTEVQRGDRVQLGALTCDVLHPTSGEGDDFNNSSVVLRLVYNQVAFLFVGDAEAKAEADILASVQPLKATVLKVGHHGSDSSSTPEFLARVQPEVAIYCAGTGNSYRHPHAETLAALARIGAQVYGTDVNGTIVVTSDGSTYTVEVTRQGQPRAPEAADPQAVAALQPA